MHTQYCEHIQGRLTKAGTHGTGHRGLGGPIGWGCCGRVAQLRACMCQLPAEVSGLCVTGAEVSLKLSQLALHASAAVAADPPSPQSFRQLPLQVHSFSDMPAQSLWARYLEDCIGLHISPIHWRLARSSFVHAQGGSCARGCPLRRLPLKHSAGFVHLD